MKDVIMKVLKIVLLSFLICNCQPKQEKENLKVVTVDISNIGTKYMLKRSKNPIEENFKVDYVSSFDKFNPAKGIAYRVGGPIGNSSVEEYRSKKDSVIIVGDDLKKLHAMLSNSKSYFRFAAGCYEPDYGFLLFDSLNQVRASFTICLSCNGIKTNPNINSLKNKPLDEYIPYGMTDDVLIYLLVERQKWGKQWEYDLYNMPGWILYQNNFPFKLRKKLKQEKIPEMARLQEIMNDYKREHKNYN